MQTALSSWMTELVTETAFKSVTEDNIENTGVWVADALTEGVYDLLDSVDFPFIQNAADFYKDGVNKLIKLGRPMKMANKIKGEDPGWVKNSPQKEINSELNSEDALLKEASNIEASNGMNTSNSYNKQGNSNTITADFHRVIQSWDLPDFNYDSVNNSTSTNISMGSGNILNSIVNSFNTYGYSDPSKYDTRLSRALYFDPQLINYGGNKYGK